MDEKILIVDDDKDILFAMSAICEFEGWKPIVASNVLEGVEKFKKLNPDIVLIDYHMPMINGIQGVRMFRDFDENTPIIALTVEEDQKVADEFINAGACDFALKPIKAPDIISRIKVHIRISDMRVQDNKDKKDIEYVKGITSETLNIILEYLETKEDYISLNKISKGTGFAYQTIHRYMQYMEETKMVKTNLKYGKLGRPQKAYKL